MLLQSPGIFCEHLMISASLNRYAKLASADGPGQKIYGHKQQLLVEAQLNFIYWCLLVFSPSIPFCWSEETLSGKNR